MEWVYERKKLYYNFNPLVVKNVSTLGYMVVKPQVLYLQLALADSNKSLYQMNREAARHRKPKRMTKMMKCDTSSVQRIFQWVSHNFRMTDNMKCTLLLEERVRSQLGVQRAASGRRRLKYWKGFSNVALK